jgi:methylated-DNA-[protein]-cysteine S-methyltransferase
VEIPVRATTLQGSVVVDTSLGRFGIDVTPAGVARIRLPGSAVGPDRDAGSSDLARRAAAQLAEYARGERREFDLPLDWGGVDPAQRHVLETLVAVAPYGRTVTYGELGARSGVDDAREVGVHMATNPLPVVVPCHRVVASDGLGGYGGGLALKRRLLELEGALPPSLDLGDA